jgi:hypothetical protein
MQRLNAVREANRAPDMLAPVRGIGRRRQRASGDIGDQRDAWRAMNDGRRIGPERVEHGVHEVRVEGVRDGERLGFDPGRLQLRDHARHRVPVAGNDGALGAVHRGNLDLARIPD